MALTPAKHPIKLPPGPGSAVILAGVPRHVPWHYRWLPNGAKHDPHGPGWAFIDGPGYTRPRSHQSRFAGACGRWLLRGQLCIGPGGRAIIRRHEGFYHWQDGQWLGPLNWTYTGSDPQQRIIAAALPVKKWVSLFGKLPDLPPHAFVN